MKLEHLPYLQKISLLKKFDFSSLKCTVKDIYFPSREDAVKKKGCPLWTCLILTVKSNWRMWYCDGSPRFCDIFLAYLYSIPFCSFLSKYISYIVWMRSRLGFVHSTKGIIVGFTYTTVSFVHIAWSCTYPVTVKSAVDWNFGWLGKYIRVPSTMIAALTIGDLYFLTRNDITWVDFIDTSILAELTSVSIVNLILTAS